MSKEENKDEYEEFRIAWSKLILDICDILKIPEIVEWLAKILNKRK